MRLVASALAIAVALAAADARADGLSPDQVRRVVVLHVAIVRACYELAVQRTPGLQGTITLSWDVTPRGLVEHAAIASSTVHDATLEKCMLDKLTTWHFPSNDAPTHIAAYPFVFAASP